MISRMAEILGAFKYGERQMSASEISRRTGIPKATVARIVNSMIDHGFLERRETGVQLGIKFFELGQQAARPTDLRQFAYQSMRDLVQATGQTVHLAVLDDLEVVYVQILRNNQSPALPSRVGGRLPAHATGLGKALLAFERPDLLAKLASEPLKTLGPRTITDFKTLDGQFELIRQNRIAYEREESAAGIACAAAPIMKNGRAVAAISISVKIDALAVEKMGPAVSAVARALSRQSHRLLTT